jgi:signal transduction histidine kinase
MGRQIRPQGCALRCRLRGRIVEVLQENLGSGDAFAPGKNVGRAIHPGGFPKWQIFLQEIRTKGGVLDWDFFVPFGSRLEGLRFGGAIRGKDLYLVAARDRDRLLSLFRRWVPGGKDVLKKTGEEEGKEPNPKEEDMYDRMAVLYNELATLHRQLFKKSIEIERLSKQKDRFLGMAAHDLRHPLGIIGMLCGFLLEEVAPALSREHADYLATIRTHIESMQKLVDDFLDVAAIESGRLPLDRKPTDLLEIFKKNTALNRLLAAKKAVRLDLLYDEGLPKVVVDAKKIEQVLNNLVSNALKFSPEGGKVEVELRRSDDRIVFGVSDQGPGISPELLPKLFAPSDGALFPDADGRQGAGLGLIIARKIVDAHNGRIWAESGRRRGAAFHVSLPSRLEGKK